MIEVEKKLNPSFETAERIKNDAAFIGSKTMNDVLYDYPDLSLIKNDIWLRKRNGKFDLKMSKDKDRKNRFLDIYDEIEHELCHIRHMNHGTKFYKFLEKILPDWKLLRRKLKEMQAIA
jgi:adenylate cyclase class IV